MGKIIGIDLGTTNSCVAIMEGKSAKAVPGEPISFASAAATNAPFTPATLSSVTIALSSPAALLNVANGPPGDVPNATLARRVPLPSNRLT